MAEALNRVYGVQRVEFAWSSAPFGALANRVQLDDVHLHYCRYDTSVQIDFSEMAGFRQFFQIAGAGELQFSQSALPIDADSSAIIPPRHGFKGSYGDHYAHLVVQYDEETLGRKFELIYGAKTGKHLRPATLKTLPARGVARTRSIALALAHQFGDAGPVSDIAVSELSQALVSSFLLETVGPPEGSAKVDGLASVAQADLLEQFMQSHWHEPLTVESVANACGVSVRSVFAQFKRRRGVSPMAYLRDLRLENARRRLMSSPDVSVMDVALACGFSSLGHFARRFREKFGELPSTTVARGARRGS